MAETLRGVPVTEGTILQFKSDHRSYYGRVGMIIPDPIENRDGTWSSWSKLPDFAIIVSHQLTENNVHVQSRYPANKDGDQIVIVSTPSEEVVALETAPYMTKATLLYQAITVVSEQDLPSGVRF